MKHILSLLLVTVVLSSLLGCSSTGGKDEVSSLSSDPAVTSLMQTAGVTANQAIGGLGSILSLAKSKVTPWRCGRVTRTSSGATGRCMAACRAAQGVCVPR